MKSKSYGERFVYSCCSQSLNGESEVINTAGTTEIPFSEDLTGNITLFTEGGDDRQKFILRR